MDKASALKNLKRDIENKPRGRVGLFKGFKRGLELEDTLRHTINKMSSSENCIPPEV